MNICFIFDTWIVTVASTDDGENRNDYPEEPGHGSRCFTVLI